MATDPESDAADLPELLAGGLAAGFGPPTQAAGPFPAPSVMDRLRRDSGVRPQILLRQESSSTPLLLRPLGREDTSLPRELGKYQLQGELARGGIGIVLKGHDSDLGRDVAFKVLRKEHCNDPDLLQRFVEEAQIGGQLQHPGIVPVYELGMQDGKPFFSMKLVKGRTLATLLAESRDRCADSPRLIGIFESICQTVAYAHARGVVHRDLKPANVMVGAFGEVLVVDWGLAKVQTQADDNNALKTAVHTVRSQSSPISSMSISGSVMGTPPYMSPEQANGDVARIDERADVFSLGAVLCEILTGKPPYTGDNATIIELARQCATDDARQRLATCGADPALVAVCGDCLRAELDSRPRDAKAVADRVSTYVHSVEARARQAQIEAAEAQVRAAGERRARRLTLGLAASVLISLGLGAGGYLWFEGAARERQRQVEGKVQTALKEATYQQGQSNWRASLSAAHRARDLINDDVRESLRQEVADELSQIESNATAARQREQLHQRSARLLARLDEIRQPELGATPGTANWGATNWSALADAYRRAFASEALRPLEGSEAEAMRQIQEQDAPVQLAAQLDAWAQAAHRSTRQADVDRLSRIANAIDDEPRRQRLRLAAASGDLDGLKQSAGGPDLRSWQPATLHLLGSTLFQLGGKKTALAVYRTAQHAHPNDFVLTFGLARALSNQVPPRHAEAVRYCLAARAIRPDNVEAMHSCGTILETLGELQRALSMYRAAIARRPDDSHLQLHLGCTLLESGQHLAALEALRTARLLIAEHAKASVDVDHVPSLALANVNLGSCLLALGRGKEAILPLREAIRLQPESLDDTRHEHLVVALLGQQKHAIVIEDYRTAVQRQPQRAAYHWCLGAGILHSGQARKAAEHFRTATGLAPGYFRGYRWLAHATMYFDLGAADQAITRAIELDQENVDGWSTAVDVYQRLGQHGKTIAALEKCIALRPEEVSFREALGNLQLGARKLDAAVEQYRAALALAPKRRTLHANIGQCLAAQGRTNEAIQALQTAVDLGVESATVFHNLAKMLSLAEHTDRAIATAREALRLAPDRVDYRITLASNLETRGDYLDASKEFAEALRRQPDHQRSRCLLGATRLLAGQTRTGIDDLRAAMLADKSMIDGVVSVAQYLAESPKKRFAAVRMLELALEHRPGDARIEGLLEQWRR